MKLSLVSLLFAAVSLANGDAVEQGHRMLALDTSTCGTGADECCVGGNACLWAGNGGGTATVKSRSCVGDSSCVNLGKNLGGSATIDEDSCEGNNSCENGGMSGTLQLGAGSCTGFRSCRNGGRNAGASLIAGPGSCVGGATNSVCDQAGSIGTAEIGARSCVGDRACSEIGKGGTATVGDDSCLGYQSCFYAAREDGEVHIGDNSCQGKTSCRSIGQSAVEHEGLDVGPITIGSNSCNCEGCCGCLKAGDVVPDNMCNSLGDGPNECCMTVGDRNPFGPIGDNNLCWDQIDQCRKATVSGDPHITTFSGVRYDCMGQGEFILSRSLNVSDPLEIRGLFVDPEFSGEADPWDGKTPQTVTRGVSFIVDPDVPRVTVTTDGNDIAYGATCGLYFHIEGVGVVSQAQMLTDHSLLRRPDVAITSGGDYDMRFKFGDYEADLSVTVSSTARQWGCVMSFSSCLKSDYHGDVVGLFGTNNQYKNDDWTTPAGVQLTIPTNPRDKGSIGLASEFCLENWCFDGLEADSWFGADYTYYSRCNINPYSEHFDPDAFETMLTNIIEICNEEEYPYNIPSEALYDTALEHHITNAGYDSCPVEDIEAMRTLNEVAVFNCERTPPPEDNERPEIGGDPHITTWKNEHYEFHGQCDLVMVKDEGFADGLGLDVHIRTKLVRYWSYIQSVAIRIGNDILEIEGSAEKEDEEAHYWINYEYQGEAATIGGFPIIFKKQVAYKRQYVIDLSPKYPGKDITIQLYKEFVRVKLNGSEAVFGNTVGLLGDYKTGKTLARDGITVLDDFTALGEDWQVLPADGRLFRTPGHPQFPEKCLEPEDPRGERKRRLGESSVSAEDAEKACASLKDPLAIKDCVYDVLATQDLDMVGAF